MLDKVVRLRKGGFGGEKLQAEAGLGGEKMEPQPAVSQGPYDVTVQAYARAPAGLCQLKLWDPHGRDPTLLDPDYEIGKNPPQPWRLGPAEKLDGRTLTWSVRLAASAPTSFEFRLEVLQGGTPLPDGRFSYSGPLEPGEFEERDGRFHFKVE